MTVIRLACGSLWIHSPVEFSAGLLEEFRALGPPAYLIAPSRTHDLYLAEWLEALSDVTSYAAPELARVKTALHFDELLRSDLVAPWSGEIDFVAIEGAPRLDEHVFFHKRSGTLIVADIIFNLVERRPWFQDLLLRAAGAKGPIRTDRPVRMLIRDHAAFRRSIARVLEWPFERVVVGHGQVIERDQTKAVREHLAGL